LAKNKGLGDLGFSEIIGKLSKFNLVEKIAFILDECNVSDYSIYQIGE
jgi:hypothetical protein